MEGRRSPRASAAWLGDEVGSSTCGYLPGSQQPTRQSQHRTASRAAGLWPSPLPAALSQLPTLPSPLPTGHWAALIVICLTTSPSHSARPATHPSTTHTWQSMNILLMLADVRSLPHFFLLPKENNLSHSLLQCYLALTLKRNFSLIPGVA